MKTVSPNIFVNDIHATIAFYKLLDFTEQDEVIIPSGEKIFSLMTNGSVTFMFQTFTSIEGQHPMVSRANGGSLLLYIKMKGIHDYFEKVKAMLPVLTGLEKTFYGATEFSIRDNNNYLLTFAEQTRSIPHSNKGFMITIITFECSYSGEAYGSSAGRIQKCNPAADFMAYEGAIQQQLVDAVGSWGALAIDIGCSLWVVCRGAVVAAGVIYAAGKCVQS